MKTNVAIIGGGIGGLMAAYRLKKNDPNIEITIVERGFELEKRKCPAGHDKACVHCKVCSITGGYAGAGAFSDGKLTCGLNSPHIRTVLKTLCRCGAPEDILIDAKPHVGTDYLHIALVNLRQELLSLGADIRRLDD